MYEAVRLFFKVQSLMPVGGYQGRDGPVQTGVHEDVVFSDFCSRQVAKFVHEGGITKRRCPQTWVGKYIARTCAHLVVGSTRASVKRKVACFGPWTE